MKAYKIPADGKITLKAGERAILTGLQTGTYTVEETKPSQSNCSATKVSVNGGASAESLTANVEVTETSKGLARVDYENIYVGGDLTVSKTVDGTACDKDKFFNFKVELSDKTLKGTYGEMEFVGGEANFQLKHGESKKTSLPTGIVYKVTENPDGYTPNVTEVSGTIVENGDHKADFINTKIVIQKNPVKNLTAMKNLATVETQVMKAVAPAVKAVVQAVAVEVQAVAAEAPVVTLAPAEVTAAAPVLVRVLAARLQKQRFRSQFFRM